jgi:polyhydroxyalkanoate synthesis regulator phasin
MANKDAFQRYLDAGVAFTNLTRARAEELVRELVQSGEFQAGDARAKVEELIERSRKGREVLVAQVQHEVTRQLAAVGITSLEDLAQQVATLLGRSAEAGRAAASGATRTASKPSPSKKSTPAHGGTKKSGTTKTSTAKKAAATKAAAKKSPGQKAAAQKTAAKKSAAKRAPSSATHAPPGSAD